MDIESFRFCVFFQNDINFSHSLIYSRRLLNGLNQHPFHFRGKLSEKVERDIVLEEKRKNIL